jgi:uncharacterized protein YqgV (UPF0045/DUF77 family)
MTSKNQLQSKIQELEAELQEFKQQLNTYKETPTIQEASVGDVLEDGSIVLQKSNGLALLVAPSSTEVEATWSKEFAEVFQKLKEQGFNPSQWFVPTKEQLQLAYKTIRDEFSATFYWSSTEFNATIAFFVSFYIGGACFNNKSGTLCVRAFRCVTY